MFLRHLLATSEGKMYHSLFSRSYPRLRTWGMKDAPCRRMSVAVSDDIRSRLQTDLKASMKSKDTVTATTIRSVLAEVYAADKTAKDGKIPSATIFSLLRKAKTRRVDAASKFKEASRSDLAEKEEREANLLDAFLPPLLSEADIDRVLKTIISEHRAEGEDRKRAMGKVMKAFYAKVDRSTVDPQLVTARVEALLASS